MRQLGGANAAYFHKGFVMNDIEQRLARWISKFGQPDRRADPDQEIDWLLHDALEEIRKLKAQLKLAAGY